MIAQEEIGEYLLRLSSREPTPGGGAVGAVHLAQSAALLAMVSRFTSGQRYHQVQERAEEIVQRADALVSDALGVADDDERLFAAVIESYQLPRGEEQAQQRRAEAIAEATAKATEPQLQTIAMASEIIDLACDLAQIGNRNLLSDVSAAAESARAALGTAVVTLKINEKYLKDEASRTRLHEAVVEGQSGMERAVQVSMQVQQVLDLE